MTTYQQNIQTYRAFIQETGFEVLTTEWVLQMLSKIEKSQGLINPAWLRAERDVWFSGQPKPYSPAMTVVDSTTSPQISRDS